MYLLNISQASAKVAKCYGGLLEDESGQDLIEYALVAALIGLGAVVTVRSLGTKIAGAFTNIGTTLTSNT
jgi:pilus assembly protein Flp/PilA